MPGQYLPLELYNYRKCKANFIICPSCFWCASCLKADYIFQVCLQCRNKIVDSLPISDNEFYKIELWDNGNVELVFESA